MTKANDYCKQAIEMNKIAQGDKVDMINHPKHYCREDAIECLDEMRLRIEVKHCCLKRV